jgi:hypothetical protein
VVKLSLPPRRSSTSRPVLSPGSTAEYVVLGLLLAMNLVMLRIAVTYAPDARRFPVLVSAAFIVLVLIHAVEIAVRGRRRRREDSDAGRAREREVVIAAPALPEWMAIAWIVGLGVALELLGLVLGSAVFLIAFLVIQARRSIIFAALCALAYWGVIHVLFIEVLSIRFASGRLF